MFMSSKKETGMPVSGTCKEKIKLNQWMITFLHVILLKSNKRYMRFLKRKLRKTRIAKLKTTFETLVNTRNMSQLNTFITSNAFESKFIMDG